MGTKETISYNQAIVVMLISHGGYDGTNVASAFAEFQKQLIFFGVLPEDRDLQLDEEEVDSVISLVLNTGRFKFPRTGRVKP